MSNQDDQGRLPASLEGVRLSIMALSNEEKVLLRHHIDELLRVTNAEVNVELSGDSKWRIGQMVKFVYQGELQVGVLLGAQGHEVNVWAVDTDRFKHYSMRLEDMLAIKGAPRIPCERLGKDSDAPVVVTELGEEIANGFVEVAVRNSCTRLPTAFTNMRFREDQITGPGQRARVIGNNRVGSKEVKKRCDKNATTCSDTSCNRRRAA